MSVIIDKTEAYVVDLLTTKLDENYLYHNLRHTERVVKSTKEILKESSLSDKEQEILILTAWFHDTGYTKGYKNHEKSSCEIATNFLTENNYENQHIELVNNCIMATKRGHEPTNTMEEVICDADSSHVAKDSYPETSEILREELKRLGVSEYGIMEWRVENIKMFSSLHRFYTDYAKKNWQKNKDKNLKKLLKAQKKQKKAERKEKLKVKFKNESPERAVQTMFRVALRNHINLSSIADTKANILLSVNAIIISLALSNLIPKLDNPSNVYLILPTAIFILFSIASMVLSILATRPSVTRGEFTKEDVKNRDVNLIFFGNFHKMELKDYEWALQEMVNDKEYLYSALTKDLYFLGKVLDRKYKILRLTYTIFMTGIILSVAAFGIAFRYNY